MLSFDVSPEWGLFYAAAALLLILLWAVAIYVMEVRRAGSNPWTEWYNDKVVPLRLGRSSLHTRRPTDSQRPAPGSRPKAA